MSKYNMEYIDFGDTDKYAPRFASVELNTFGDDFAELLENLTVSHIDQDGGELGEGEITEPMERFLERWYVEQLIEYGMSNSDAQALLEAEQLKIKK